ncbi:hypothetical protein EIP91_000971 [Steccherinum ochraceum]|uniref:Autophagy-related protein 14 n=1 Tax=Steccherinum ochraceum TaxID=92696 RepID=A0A4R0REV3_9APHY|nr:hypothetical protein EIP91_000971 [Steccherinum ochraceum]
MSTSIPAKGSQVSSKPDIHSPLSADASAPVYSPLYRSATHRPSTNPSFNVDIRGQIEHLEEVDISGSRLHVEIWGNTPSSRPGYHSEHSAESSHSRKGKQKEQMGSGLKQWRVLEQWDVDLAALVPITAESQLRQLPSNTLVLSLTPPGRRYYLPPGARQSDELATTGSRPESPSLGYSSDPEREFQQRDENLMQSPALDSTRASDSVDSDLPDAAAAIKSRHDGARQTANWQDLLKLTTLQTVILDTKNSLDEVLQLIDQLVVLHPTRALNSKLIDSKNREVSERRGRIRELEAEKGVVLDECQNLRDQIDSKREALRIRRRTLREAQEGLLDETQRLSAHEKAVSAERSALLSLRSQTAPLRSSALATLASIYPIELVSPPDLLFSIVEVPLPIPIGATDPAPPTSLPAHRDVNEDSVATALGFAAHVVHLLAAYTNKNLTYPITYIGSRSLIKDGISAMVGPRMFPLFSKGVDTYRFEYGVFLLNKNIEMLMVDRDLRALDMRHTLPNLKNLLLTLTDPDSTPNKRLRPDTSNDSGLHSPSTISSMLSEEDAVQRNEEAAQASEDAESPVSGRSTAPSAGSATPTQAATTRKSRTFLDLGPLTGFLKSRYPSASKTTSTAEVDRGESSTDATTADAVEEPPSQEADADDEDDRRTIRDTRGEAEVAEDKTEESLGTEEVADATADQVAGEETLEKVQGGAVQVPRGQAKKAIGSRKAKARGEPRFLREQLKAEAGIGEGADAAEAS